MSALLAANPAPRPLYLMFKPPQDIVDKVLRYPRIDRTRADRLHATVMILGDRCRTPGLLETARAAMASFSAPSVDLLFGRIHSSIATVALLADQTYAARRFHRLLHDHLVKAGLRLPAYRFRPHITLAYRPDGRGSAPIDPIRWSVEDICLIESVHGEGRHIEHGRWRLAAGIAGREAVQLTLRF